MSSARAHLVSRSKGENLLRRRTQTHTNFAHREKCIKHTHTHILLCRFGAWFLENRTRDANCRKSAFAGMLGQMRFGGRCAKGPVLVRARGFACDAQNARLSPVRNAFARWAITNTQFAHISHFMDVIYTAYMMRIVRILNCVLYTFITYIYIYIQHFGNIYFNDGWSSLRDRLRFDQWCTENPTDGWCVFFKSFMYVCVCNNLCPVWFEFGFRLWRNAMVVMCCALSVRDRW